MIHRLLSIVLLLLASAALAVQPNATDQSVYFFVIDADGNPATEATVNSAMSDVVLWYQVGATSLPVDENLTVLAAANTAHTDNRGRMIAPGIMRVDPPDSPWAGGQSVVRLWLDLTSVDPDFQVAGGFVEVPLGYGLQQPDSSTTAIARASDVTTINGTLSTIGTNVSTGVTQTTAANIRSAVGLTSANLNTLLTTIDTVVDSILVDTGNTLPAQIAANDSSEVLQRLRNHVTTGEVDQQVGEQLLLADDPATPNAYIGSSVLIGTQLATISAYEPPEEEGSGVYTLSAGLSPIPSGSVAVTIYGDPQAALIAYEVASQASVDDVQEAVEAIDSSGTVTPLAERPANPARQRKVRRDLEGGLVFDTIVIDVDDTNPAWWIDFTPELQGALGIAATEGAVAVEFDPGAGLEATATRTGDRPSKGVLIEFDPTTAGSYEMAVSVTYEGQGTHVARGTVTVRGTE